MTCPSLLHDIFLMIDHGGHFQLILRRLFFAVYGVEHKNILCDCALQVSMSAFFRQQALFIFQHGYASPAMATSSLLATKGQYLDMERIFLQMKCVVTSITCVGKHRQKQATQTENNHHSFYATLTSQLPIFINILSESKRSSTAGRLYRCYINSTSTNVQSIHLIRGKHSVLLCL